MIGQNQPRARYRILVAIALGAFLVAALCLAGILFPGSARRRGIVGIVSCLASAGCLGATYYARLRQVDDLRTSLLAQAREGAAQQERNRLARELHDSIKQQIFGISASAAAVEARWDADPEGARAALRDVRQNAQEAMAEMNALLQQLSPAPLERVGLTQALRDQCEALGYRTDAEVTVDLGEIPPGDRLPAQTEESLFRIAQEAFSNIARHARASRVHVALGQQGTNTPLALEIRDDGQGFAPEATTGGMGLENIRQRVSALGGELTLESAPGEGTVLCVTVPLAKPARAEAQIPPNHTLNKVFLVGLGGGLALIAALYYPLYVLVPGGIVAGWQAGSSALGLASEILAALLALATGLVAAWWARPGTRQAGTQIGALAGGVAGSTLYLGLGAAAAGVVGSASLLDGLVAAVGDADVVRLLSRPAIEIVWWSHGIFWGTLLAGFGLGAAGGALAPPAPPASQPHSRTDLRQIAVVILTAMGLASTLALGLAVLGLSRIEGVIREAIVEHGVSPATSLPLAGVSSWLVGTPAVFYIGSLAALYLLLRAESKQEDPVTSRAAHRTAGVFAWVAFGLPFCILALNPASIRALPTVTIVGITIAISLALSGLYLTTSLRVNRQRPVWHLDRRRIARALAVGSAIVSMVVMNWAVSFAHFWGLSIGIAVAVVNILLIAWLWRQSKQASLDKGTVAWLQMERWRSWGTGMGVGFAVVVPPLVTVSAAISIIVLPVGFIPALVGSVAEQDPAILVRGTYLAHASAFLVALVGAVAAVSLSALALGGITALVGRLVSERERDRDERQIVPIERPK